MKLNYLHDLGSKKSNLSFIIKLCVVIKINVKNKKELEFCQH